ncbi:MAG: hypothetical protein AAGA60_13745 [Cyanobacteria bacterium P01_E01_bin.42]
MNTIRRYFLSNLLLVLVLAVGFLFGTNSPANAAPKCGDLDITGKYTCNVACILRDVNDGLTGFTDLSSSETDTIEALTIEDSVDESAGMYKVEIVSGDFSETEIGPLVNCTLYTATEYVSDNQFPVLEEYIFQNRRGLASGFTKVVRNPNRADFKTCKVECTQ